MRFDALAAVRFAFIVFSHLDSSCAPTPSSSSSFLCFANAHSGTELLVTSYVAMPKQGDAHAFSVVLSMCMSSMTTPSPLELDYDRPDSPEHAVSPPYGPSSAVSSDPIGATVASTQIAMRV